MEDKDTELESWMKLGMMASLKYSAIQGCKQRAFRIFSLWTKWVTFAQWTI